MAEEGITLNFTNLPLMEAALRVTLEQPVQLSYATVYAVHESLKTEFPSLVEPTEIEIAPGAGPSPREFGPAQLPGAVFRGDSRGLRISLHPQVIVGRWVRRFGQTSPTYPRYAHLKASLWRAIDAVRGACSDSWSRIIVANMSYVNFVQVQDPSMVLVDYFSELAQVRATSGATQVRKVEAAWAEQDIDLRFVVEQGTAKLGAQKTDGYRLTTAAGRQLTKPIEPSDALDAVHERLQTFFRDLISERAKSEWGLEHA